MTTALYIFLVTVLTLHSCASADRTVSARHELTRNETTDSIKGNGSSEGIGRNGGMMMNMSTSASASMGHGGSKERKDNSLEKMNMILMMYKTLLETLLMFVSPIIEVKKFGLNVIDTFINVAKFIMEIYKSKNNVQKETWSGGSMFVGGEDRIGMPFATAYRPSYLAQYPNFMHKYNVQ